MIRPTAASSASPASTVDASGDLFANSTVEWIGFVGGAEDPAAAVVALPDRGLHAVVMGSQPANAVSSSGPQAMQADIALLVVPAPIGDAGGLPDEALRWLSSAGSVQVIALHGAGVAWAPGRAAILVEPSRIDSVRAAVVEFLFREKELSHIEADVHAGWPDVEADASMGFEFRDRDADRRHVLGERFRRTIGLRSRLSRLLPHLDRPPVHPPTLASQVGERLRERSRMAERADFLDGQLEVQERVYDLCAQRASDWTIARKSTTLEWAIVVLLAVETVLILVGLLSSRGG